MTDEDRKLLRENNNLLKNIDMKLDCISQNLQIINVKLSSNTQDDVKNFVINVIANALVGNR